MTDSVTILIERTKTGFSQPLVEEFSLILEKSELSAIKDKLALTSLIMSKGFLKDVNPLKLSYKRKSKKSKRYVALETPEDFKTLGRSLKVKSLVRLQLRDGTTPSAEPTGTDQQFPVDFGKMANALVEAAIEHFKEIVQELSTSHVQPLDKADSPPSLIVHESASCDRCSPIAYKPIRGVRFRCLVCADFDLCGECEAEVQSLKECVGGHKPDHTMAKIIKPEGRFEVPSSSNHPSILDLQLNNFGPEDKDVIQTFLANEDAREIMSNFLQILRHSRRYEELLRLISSDTSEDNELQHAKLLSLLEHALSKNSQANETSADVQFKKKEFASNSGLLSVLLTNSSNVPVGGGDLEFRFSGEPKARKSFWVNNTLPIQPGRKKRFNLPSLPSDFTNVADTQLSIWADSVKILECPFLLEDTPNFELAPSLVVESNRSSDLTPKKEEVLVAKIFPISAGMATVHLSNLTSSEFDCGNITFQVMNCFGRTICDTSIRKQHGIKPERSAKFNIPLRSGHMKFPFKLLISNGAITAVWELNSKQLSGVFRISGEGIGNTKDDEESTGFVDDGKEMEDIEGPSASLSLEKSKRISQSSQVILPNLPRESLNNSKISSSEYEDAESSLIAAEQESHTDDISDYDIISVDGDIVDEDEATSDFEVLSTVTSEL